MKKTKIVALLLVIALVVSAVVPMMAVMADTTYTYTIAFDAQQGHSVTKDNGHVKIDGAIVELRDANGNPIGVVNDSGTQITVNDGPAGQLSYNGNNLFTLYNTNGHTAHNMNEYFTSNAVFLVEDYAKRNGNDSSSSGRKAAAFRGFPNPGRLLRRS